MWMFKIKTIFSTTKYDNATVWKEFSEPSDPNPIMNPDLNWGQILDPDPNLMYLQFASHNTASNKCLNCAMRKGSIEQKLLCSFLPFIVSLLVRLPDEICQQIPVQLFP